MIKCNVRIHLKRHIHMQTHTIHKCHRKHNVEEQYSWCSSVITCNTLMLHYIVAIVIYAHHTRLHWDKLCYGNLYLIWTNRICQRRVIYLMKHKFEIKSFGWIFFLILSISCVVDVHAKAFLNKTDKMRYSIIKIMFFIIPFLKLENH